MVCGEVRIPAHKAVLRKSIAIGRAFHVDFMVRSAIFVDGYTDNFKENHTSEHVFDGPLEHILALLYSLHTYQYPDDEGAWEAFVGFF